MHFTHPCFNILANLIVLEDRYPSTNLVLLDWTIRYKPVWLKLCHLAMMIAQICWWRIRMISVLADGCITVLNIACEIWIRIYQHSCYTIKLHSSKVLYFVDQGCLRSRRFIMFGWWASQRFRRNGWWRFVAILFICYNINIQVLQFNVMLNNIHNTA